MNCLRNLWERRVPGRSFRDGRVAAFFIAMIFAAVSGLHAGVPGRINFQGKLSDTGNNPRTGSYDFTFRIFDVPSGGGALWTETQSGVAVANGLFSVQLGSTTAIPVSVLSGATTYLEVQVGAEVGTPRERLAAVPYALRAAEADSLSGGGLVMSSATISGSGFSGTESVFLVGAASFSVLANGNVGIGTAAPAALLTVYNNSDEKLRLSDDGVNQWNYLSFFDGGSRKWYAGQQMTNGDFSIGNDSAGAIFNVSPAGSVGIAGTAPEARLDVVGPQQGTVTTLGSEVPGLIIEQRYAAGTGVGPMLEFRTNDGSQIWTNSAIATRDPLDGSYSGEMMFYTSPGGVTDTTGRRTRGASLAERLRIDKNGNVGVGSAAPAYRLHVAGNALVTSSAVVSGSGLSGTTPVFQVVGGTFTVLANGNVGVGTAGPTGRFHVYNSNGVGVGVDAPSGTARDIQWMTNATARWILRANSTAEAGGDAGSDFQIMSRTDAGAYKADVLFFKRSSGNVGIGNTGPSLNLVVGNDLGALSFPGKASVVGNSSGEAMVAVGQDGTHAVELLWNYNATPANAVARLVTYAYNNPIQIEGSALALQFQSGGNVGIGTSTPTAKLHIISTSNAVVPFYLRPSRGNYDLSVNDYGTITAVAGNSADWAVFGTMLSGDTYQRLTFGLDSGAGFLGFGPGNTTRDVFLKRASGDLAFSFGVSTQEKVRIAASGNVGIGAALPEGRLHLLSDSTADKYVFLTSHTVTGYGLVVSTSGNVGVGTAAPEYNLTVNGTAWVTSGAWSGSDRRWKKDIKPLKGALDKILLLQGVGYNWKTEEFPGLKFSPAPQFGLIAQDAEKVLPEVVTTDSSGYKGISYEKLVPVLIEAIKEQQREIEELRSKVAGARGD